MFLGFVGLIGDFNNCGRVFYGFGRLRKMYVVFGDFLLIKKLLL